MKLNVFKDGDRVKIEHRGKMVDATLINRSDWSGTWWLEVWRDGTRDVVLHYEDDLVRWNYGSGDCECGGESTNQPGHSQFCPKFIKE